MDLQLSSEYLALEYVLKKPGSEGGRADSPKKYTVAAPRTARGCL